jgi:cobyrinic acid a,c-diamide synthase
MIHFFVSAIHKSSGKTTISIGLAAALSARGQQVRTFKKGPDYIDPMWLARASGRVAYNLDFNTQTEGEILSTYAQGTRGADVTLIEGNKGLHDGVDPAGRDSSAALAKLLKAPVVLVVDVAGMTRGIAPLMLGYKAFDPEVELAGVILNKVGAARQESKLRQALENYTDIRVLGAIGRDDGLNVDERHLGLTTPGEAADRDGVVVRVRESVAQGVDLDTLLAAAGRTELQTTPMLRALAGQNVTIAVARDAAFDFYYADDLEALERAGARLVFFDALRDQNLPKCDGLLIGGGFPETQAAALEANVSLRGQIRAAIEAGLPAYAECGGLMYLSRSIEWRGARHAMVGIIPADSVMGAKPQGRGLVQLEETPDSPWPKPGFEGATPAHEFHYARLENIDPSLRFAYRMKRGYGVDGQHDGIVIGNLLASFAHLRDTSRCRWADRFVSFIRSRIAQGNGSSLSDDSGADKTKVGSCVTGIYSRMRSAS